MSRTLVMGIVNVTPDSFSDGGDWFDSEVAVRHGQELIDEGADILDIGGESTRPGAERPSVEEELRRVIPVVQGLSDAGVPLSVDTMRAEVAQAAVEAGASIVNDVSGGQADADMLSTVAHLGVRYVTMHWRAHGATMNNYARYDDVIAEVVAELSGSIEAALAAGVVDDHLIVDPGFGFSKDAGHNWQLLAHLDRIQALGFPVLVGVSRKRFLGELLGGRPPKERDAATAAATAMCASQGVWAVRSHAVRPNRDAVAVVEQVCNRRHG